MHTAHISAAALTLADVLRGILPDGYGRTQKEGHHSRLMRSMTLLKRLKLSNL